jgi:hypothetical protein
MPKGASKEVLDFMLTRYACYIIAQNGDPKSSCYIPTSELDKFASLLILL